MPPRWLKKVGKFADNLLDTIDGDLDLADTVRVCTRSGKEVSQLSNDIQEICDTTAEKRQAMIDFGTDIQETLAGLSNGGEDASILETIKSLTDGDRVKSAMEIAEGLDTVAINCVDMSIRMVTLMEEGMDSLPPVIQKAIEKRCDDLEDESGDDDDEDDVEALRGLDRDLADVTECVDSIQTLNLSTAMQVGARAFTQITDTAKRSTTLFDAMRAFALDVQEITEAIQSFNPMAIVKEAKDMLRVLKLSEDMKKIAQGAGKLIRMVIRLFQATADRVSVLWSALAFAKDCMMDCVEHVQEAKQILVGAKEQGENLMEKSRSIGDQLDGVGEFNMDSINAVKSLSNDGDIKEAIDLACTMDDMVLECTGKVVDMVNRVQEGFANLPDILTDGIDVQEQGTLDDDPEEEDVDLDLEELEEARTAMEGADILTAGRAGVRGFKGVTEKTGKCQNLLEMVQEFATNCDGTLASFLSTWDLASASQKITEMCRLVNLGKLMKDFAAKVKRIILAMVALMKAAVEKFTKGIPELFGNIDDAIDDIKDKVEDRIDDVTERIGNRVDVLKDKMKDKLEFWK